MHRFLRILPVVFGIAVILVLLGRFGLDDFVRAVQHVSPLDLVIYLGLTVAVVFGYALRWQLLMRALGRAVSLLRLASARLAGDAVGNLVPSARLAGDPVRVAIVHAGGVEGTRATAGVALDRVVETVNNIVCGLLYVSTFSLTHALGAQRNSMLLLAGLLVAAAAGLSVPLVRLHRGQRPLRSLYALWGRFGDGSEPRWLSALHRTEEHVMQFFRERPTAFVEGVLLSFAVEVVSVSEYYFLLRAFGVHVDLPTLLLALVGTGVAHAVPAPGAIGTLEGAEVAVLSLATGDPALGFLAGLIIRMHETLLAVAGLIALSSHGLSLARLPGFRAAEEAVG